jgi:hypothetical protein
MLDIVRSPYGPCEIDCTGNVACWPWAPPPAVEEIPDDVMGPEALARLDAPVASMCTAHGCTLAAAGVRRNTRPALAPFCDRHRHIATVRIAAGRTPEEAAARLRIGMAPGRPRSTQ